MLESVEDTLREELVRGDTEAALESHTSSNDPRALAKGRPMKWSRRKKKRGVKVWRKTKRKNGENGLSRGVKRIRREAALAPPLCPFLVEMKRFPTLPLMWTC